MNRLRQKLVHGKKTAIKCEKKKWNVVEQPFLHYNMLTQSLTDGGGNRLVVTKPANEGKALCFGIHRGSERKDVFSEICDQVQEIMEQHEENDSDNNHEHQQPIKNVSIYVPVQDTILPLEKEYVDHYDAGDNDNEALIQSVQIPTQDTIACCNTSMAKEILDKSKKEVQTILCDHVEEPVGDSDDDSETSDSESNTSSEFYECEQMAKQITNNSFGQHEVTSPCMGLELVNDLDDDTSDSDSILSNEFNECGKMAQQENMGEVHKLYAISLSSYQHGSDLFVTNTNGDITYHTRISMLGKKK